MSVSPDREVYVPQPLCSLDSGCGYCLFIRGWLAAQEKEVVDARE